MRRAVYLFRDLRQLGSRLAMLAWLAVMWVLLWGVPDPGTIAAGVLVGLVVMVALPLPHVPVEGRVHPISALWLGLVLLYYLVRSSITVAWVSIRPGPQPTSAVLRAPLRLRSDFLLALAVNALNLMPGGIVVRIDPRRRLVYVHVLDAGSPALVEAFRRQVQTIERLFGRAFEREGDWRASPLHDEAFTHDDSDDTDGRVDIDTADTADADLEEGPR